VSGAPIDLLRYKLVVFDLDGTLYRQAPVRRAMFLDLLRHGGAPGRYQRFKVLHHFRKIREGQAHEVVGDFEADSFRRLAARTGYDEPFLVALVKEWMEQRPLIHLKAAMVAGAGDVIAMLRRQGVTVAVWSDYPVEAKLKTLGIAVDHMLSASDKDIMALKPDPSGLRLAMDRAGVAPDATLMVGDRLSRDGAAATAANVDFLLRSDKAPADLSERQSHVRDYRAFLSHDSQLADGALAA
jgi:FMN phosphatase YigB (HAD superfamily)